MVSINRKINPLRHLKRLDISLGLSGVRRIKGQYSKAKAIS
jgi:hypothetical protein